MLTDLTSADFLPLLHQVFVIRPAGSEPLPAELIEVTELGHAPEFPGAPSRAPFSIILRGPHQPLLPQSIYHIEQATMGALDIFIVPIGPDASGMRYQAVFG